MGQENTLEELGNINTSKEGRGLHLPQVAGVQHNNVSQYGDESAKGTKCALGKGVERHLFPEH